LVATQAEASASNAKLWQGASQHAFDQILSVLKDQGVAYHFKEIARVAPKFTIFGFPLGSAQPTFEYEVYVLRSQLKHAKLAVQDIRKN